MHPTERPALILVAHDVAQDAVSISGAEANIAVTQEILVATMNHLQQSNYEFVGFDEFMERRHEGGVALLTFDDAYCSVSRVALPVLKARGIPATVFVITGSLRREADPFPIWLQLLRDRRGVLEKPAAASLLPHRLVRRVLAKSGFGTLFELLAQPLEIPTSSFRDALTQAELEEVAEAVAALPGVGRVTMTEADVLELVSSGIVDLGAHSLTHRSFARLSDWEIEAEIGGSVATLSELCGSPSSSLPFAYPYGAVTAHAARCVSRTCRAGLTCHARPLTAFDSAATLPRINLDGDAIRNCARGSLTTHILALTRERMRLHLPTAILRLGARVKQRRMSSAPTMN
jgi:peptidoglycan/xylan/chitin deacetylase (PgdA/CDA1 family)